MSTLGFGGSRFDGKSKSSGMIDDEEELKVIQR